MFSDADVMLCILNTGLPEHPGAGGEGPPIDDSVQLHPASYKAVAAKFRFLHREWGAGTRIAE